MGHVLSRPGKDGDEEGVTSCSTSSTESSRMLQGLGTESVIFSIVVGGAEGGVVVSRRRRRRSRSRSRSR